MKESDSWKIENILNYIYLLKIKQKGVIWGAKLTQWINSSRKLLIKISRNSPVFQINSLIMEL
jgi:hypothetical protein